MSKVFILAQLLALSPLLILASFPPLTSNSKTSTSLKLPEIAACLNRTLPKLKSMRSVSGFMVSQGGVVWGGNTYASLVYGGGRSVEQS